ncbi:MAG: ATP-binding protein [Leptolyngbyaceae bacterium]|nr:ATP-binding protein [Leptolyngbyaceae bacterium]
MSDREKSYGEPPQWQRYGLAILIVAIALPLTLSLQQFFQAGPIFVFLAAITLSAAYGGLAPGLLSTMLSAGCLAWVVPRGTLPMITEANSQQITISLLFVGLGTLISLLRKTILSQVLLRRHLAQANQELQVEIGEHQRLEKVLECQTKEHAAQLQQAFDLEDRLKRITDKVRDSLDEAQILQTAVQELGMGLGVRCCNAALYNLSQRTSTICYEYTTSMFSDQGYVVQMDKYPELYQQLLQGQPLQFCSITPHPVRGRVVMLACPILVDPKAFDGTNAEGLVLGDLWLINDKDYAFRDLELRLVQQVANQCAIAIRQARLYQAAQAQVLELENLNQLKDDFLSTISHELRTPMSSVKMAIRMLQLSLKQEGSLDLEQSKTAQYLKILETECQREIDLINDLLDLQQLEAGIHTLHPETIDLQAWLPTVLEPFKDRAQNRQQNLEVAIPADLPPLLSDRSSTARILTELLNNACKYTPPGQQIILIARLVPGKTRPLESGRIQLEVTSTGTDIPVSELTRIFDKFYRIPRADPWKQGGTGLGLALVKKLAEQLGGSIHVESGQGWTAFTLELAIAPQ